MEKLSIKALYLLTLAVLLTAISIAAHATKLARISLAELYNEASIVTKVKVVSSEISDYQYALAHTPHEQPFIKYTAEIIEKHKGSTNTHITFLSRTKLYANTKYFLFLNTESKYPFPTVAFAGHGAFELGYITSPQGFIEHTRIPVTYINASSLSERIKGQSKITEHAEFIWVTEQSLTAYLETLKTP